MKKRTRLAVTALLLCALCAQGAVRRLATDCTVPGGFTPSESTPFDCDWCTLNDSDDITELLKDIGNQWGAVYARAPSKTVTLKVQTTQWATAVPGKPIKTFVLLEDQDPQNRLTLRHAPPDPEVQITLQWSCTPCSTPLAYCPLGAAPKSGATGDLIQSKNVLWAFLNYSTVKIGGPNLSMTLIGTHPGLGNAGGRRCGAWPAYATNEINVGLLDFRVYDGSTPALVDLRMNTRNAEVYSAYFMGTQAVHYSGSRTQQVNISGTHWNTGGICIGGGVKNVWFDPENTLISDPYIRGYGWDGSVSAIVNGRPVGCFDLMRSANGRGHNSGPFFVDSLRGGITFEYGYLTFTPNAPIGAVGTGVEDPFVIRLKDWGSSGPGTGYPEGVQIKNSSDPIFFKGDPHPAYGNTRPFRFIKFIALPSAYGSGVYGGSLSACAPGNNSNNNYPDAAGNLIRFEANDNDGETFGWDATFEGDWDTRWTRGQLVCLTFGPWSAIDRSWGHTLRAGVGMTFTDTIRLHDHNTATGPGTFTNIVVRAECLYSGTVWCGSGTVPPKANTIRDATVSGTVTIDTSADTTTISNVNFTGSARDIISIGAGSTLLVSDLCAAAGSRITGSGTLVYYGAPQALPYTLPVTSDCGGTASEVFSASPAGLLLSVSPNPVHKRSFFRFRLPAKVEARLAVYNLSGQEVLVWPSVRGSSVSWDGRDNRGHQLPNGIYLARLMTEKYGSTTLKTAVIR